MNILYVYLFCIQNLKHIKTSDVVQTYGCYIAGIQDDFMECFGSYGLFEVLSNLR